MYAFFYLCFCSFHVHYKVDNVNIKILVCEIIGPAAAWSAGPVPTPVRSIGFALFLEASSPVGR